MKLLKILYCEMEFSKPFAATELPYYAIIIGILSLFGIFITALYLRV